MENRISLMIIQPVLLFGKNKRDICFICLFCYSHEICLKFIKLRCFFLINKICDDIYTGIDPDCYFHTIGNIYEICLVASKDSEDHSATSLKLDNCYACVLEKKVKLIILQIKVSWDCLDSSGIVFSSVRYYHNTYFYS